MLGDCLACHVQSLTQFTERLAVLRVEPVQQPAAVHICQSSKNRVVVNPENMQPFSYLSSSGVRHVMIYLCRHETDPEAGSGKRHGHQHALIGFGRTLRSRGK
jgi:hypothetical protein